MKLSFLEQKYYEEKMKVWGRDQMSCNVRTSVEMKALPSCVVFRLSQLQVKYC